MDTIQWAKSDENVALLTRRLNLEQDKIDEAKKRIHSVLTLEDFETSCNPHELALHYINHLNFIYKLFFNFINITCSSLYFLTLTRVVL